MGECKVRWREGKGGDWVSARYNGEVDRVECKV